MNTDAARFADWYEKENGNVDEKAREMHGRRYRYEDADGFGFTFPDGSRVWVNDDGEIAVRFTSGR